ncbi:MAG: hypothetical protein D3M94_05580 [Rhodocyclales bacterium GT-UBC]|nr:MAG: hypothetical protein D3M94_05580 [Rhodocyclales bacterium GT-UBC]
MRRMLLTLIFLALPAAAQAWSAAGHRLTACIAWQQLSSQSQASLGEILARHPDYPRWQARAGKYGMIAIFAEAATWADSIRNDPRYFDERREWPTPPIPGLADNARHKVWHYLDFDASGHVREGELDQQIERLTQVLRASPSPQQTTYALPWLLHLVGDIHQPLHVGRHDDEGGNQFEIENPYDRRQPFTNLHAYWDDLPGPYGLRGQRLLDEAERLIGLIPPPQRGTLSGWRDESHALLTQVYPRSAGSLLPIINERFHLQSRELAQRRIVEAGYRLGWLLESLFHSGVPRETGNHGRP